MSFGFFLISLGLLDGHNKYQELGFPTDCGEKIWREVSLLFFSKNETYFGEYQPYRWKFNVSTFFCNKKLIEKNRCEQ
jgi:hypothetical protein